MNTPIEIRVSILYLGFCLHHVWTDAGWPNFQSPERIEVRCAELDMGRPLEKGIFVLCAKDLTEGVPVTYAKGQAAEIEQMFSLTIQVIIVTSIFPGSFLTKTAIFVDDLFLIIGAFFERYKAKELVTVIAGVFRDVFVAGSKGLEGF